MRTVIVTGGLLGHEGRYHGAGATVSLPDGKADFVVRLGIAKAVTETVVTDAETVVLDGPKPEGRKNAKSNQPPG